uniref:RCC1-like domain-containing protein n=1 Tax=Globisporangium ultimum (strain ATCC 200006 / CBS 805.95 / DAOM BR144) TaxID=431595 RepID=K3WD87_GLOUD
MLKLGVPSQVLETQKQYDQLPLRKKYRKTFVKPEKILPTDEQKQHKLALVGRYYDLLPPLDPAADAPSPGLSLQELMETVEPELNVDDLALSLQMRGVYLAKETRLELVDKLGDCLELELECVGEKFHVHMKEQDKIARRLRHDRREKQVLTVAGKTGALWYDLRILMESILKIERDTFSKERANYLDMKRKILTAKQKIRRQAREGYSSSSNQEHVEPFGGSGDKNLSHVNGLTSRGAPMRDFNGRDALETIAVGSRHVLAIHQSGKLLTWGVGSFGRLGGTREPQQSTWSQNDPDSWHSDVHAPEVVDALKSSRFRSVACGFGHNLALSTQGQVFVWGSATHGKLGIGTISENESFTLSPLPLPLPTGMSVRKIACGPSHSALLTTDGSLYVWGCGDGGKLGLGDGRDVGQNRIPRNGGQLGIVSTPTRVIEPFGRENLVEVSCGTAHTAVLSAIETTTSSGEEKRVGGRVYVAGSNHALAKFTPSFTLLPIVNDDDKEAVAMTKLSCGNAHTALISTEGELFTWGKNVGGCAAHSVLIPLVKVPTRVSCMYQRPANLCLRSGVHALQSTQSAACLPEYALRKESFAQTQQEVCPFWQVTLQNMSRIERVRVILWKPLDGDDDAAAPQTLMATTRPSTSSGATLKYTILISESAFDTEERGKYSLAKAKSHSTHAGFALLRDQKELTWTPPVDTFGRFVRVQIDNATAMLSLSVVEVVGMNSTEYKGPKVSEVECGEAMTAVVCRPLSSMEMLRERFLRAVRTDRASLWILEQIETFHPFLNEELVVNGHDGQGRMCILCRPHGKCVVCLVEAAIIADGKLPQQTKIVSDPSSITAMKENEAKKREALCHLTLEELCQRLMTMNMRTEEEEEAQQKQLEQELTDLTALAKQKLREEQEGAQLAVVATNGSVSGNGLLEKLRKALGFGKK